MTAGNVLTAVNTVLLPWPPAALSPNKRKDRRALTDVRRGYKNTAWALTLEARLDRAAGRHLTITFLPPDRRRRDLDNMLASLKAGLDGLAIALGVDDSEFALTLRRGAPVKDGRVEITIGAGPAPSPA